MYVKRVNGIIVEAAMWPIEGVPNEWLDPSNPELIAFLNPQPQIPDQMVAVQLSRLKDANKKGDWSAINDITLSLFNTLLKG